MKNFKIYAIDNQYLLENTLILMLSWNKYFDTNLRLNIALYNKNTCIWKPKMW